ncbi:MAG: transglycosylase SLT domain-containing protein [Bacteroidales bacterium]|nr:transglycosylase SLT domain-containing protein [Bacteroidales bacterium]MBN2750608.1 transglycosylase SLT domain-containing protein [Bacteroidales bacterium]
MKKLFAAAVLGALSLFFSNGLNAQSPNKALPDSTLEAMMLYQGFSNNLDSLLNLWYVQQALDTNNFIEGVELDSIGIHSNIPDSVYINRLAQINSIIDLPFNSIVRSYINVYTQKKRDRVEVMLGLTDYYFPIFEEVLDLYQLPTELRMLPVIESALNPRAVSRAGATGLWQFMYGTGRMYKLTINSYVDERRDPIASSHAAARFLKDLYSIYKDWTLVIAAYNCGPGNVNKAIRRSGGKRNYWDIYYHLPRETRGYVPAFIAATYALTYHKEHNINPVAMNLPLVSDTIMVNDMLHLNQVAEVLNIPVSTLRDLNPQYKMDIIPAKEKGYVLRIPMETVGQYIDNEQKIFAYKDSIYFNPKNRIDPTKFKSSYQYDVPNGSKKLVYKVKQGDVLGTIAQRHGVSIRQLRAWNNIRGNLIRVGQRLTIYVKG